MHRLFSSPNFCGFTIFHLMVGVVGLALPSRSQTLYDFGNPTAEEQLYLEMINRARANPSSEGARLAATTDADVLSAYSQFHVNLTKMQSEFNALPVTAPLAPNAKLTTTARNHSAWMLANALQEHNEGTVTPFARMTAAGYSYSNAAENIYAYAKSVWFGHAGFEVDWGDGTSDGMQTKRGHRANIHNANLREIGVGMVTGSNGDVGPQLVTQDFGTQSTPPTLGTGVAYYDLNSNNFYDIGEGIAGLTVNLSGTTHYCTTAQGGGWTVPVPNAAATRTVSFTGLNMNQNVNLTFPASTNAKADLKLNYTPPAITSSSSATTNTPHTIVFNAIGGAATYKWNRWTASASIAENCENTTNITTFTTGSYSVLNTGVKQQGTASFHLAIPDFTSQSFQLNALYYGNPSASISFQSRIRAAFSSEHFKVQVKEEGGIWIDVYDQAGLGSTGEASFTPRTAALTAMVGKAFRVRFLQQYTSGSIYGVADNTGWFVDAINFTNVSALSSNNLQTLTTNTGSYTPATAGSYLMSVTPVISGHDFAASYQTLIVTSGSGNPPTVSVAVSPANVTEDGAPNLVYTFTRSGATTASLTANFTVGGSAAFSTDYTQSGAASFTATTGTVNFAAGATTATVTLDPIADTTAEVDETVILTVISDAGYTAISPIAATGTIANDDTNISVTVSPASVVEDGSPNLSYTFTRSGVISGALTANFSVGGIASFSTDYTQSGAATFTATTGTVSFSSNATTKTVTLNPTADTTVETDETAVLTVTSGTGYSVISPSTATGTITNDDAIVSIAVSPSSVPEDSGQEIIYTFSRSGVSTGALTANFSVAGTAAPNVDYSANGAASFNTNSGTVTFPAGSTSVNVRLNPTTDPGVEPDESVVLSVTSNTGYQVGGTPSATGIIANDDISPPTFLSWATALETTYHLVAGTISANPNGDYDKDGRPNLVEFAFGASPVIANDPAPGMPALQPSTTHLTLRYNIDTSLSGVTVTPQASATLGSWTESTPSVTDTLISTSGTIQTHEAKVPLTSGNKVFMRMQVTIP